MRADELLTLARAYADAHGLALSTVGVRVCKNERIFTRLADGAGCNVKTLEKAADWLGKNWPADIPWPVGVPRPEHTTEAA